MLNFYPRLKASAKSVKKMNIHLLFHYRLWECMHKLCTYTCVKYIYTTIQMFWTGNICLFWKNGRLSKNPEKHWFPQQYEAAQLFSTLIIIKNVSWVQNQHFTKISEGLCDLKDWSNGNGQLYSSVIITQKYLNAKSPIRIQYSTEPCNTYILRFETQASSMNVTLNLFLWVSLVADLKKSVSLTGRWGERGHWII